MLLLLYGWLSRTEAARYLNFLRYPTFRITAAAVASLVLGMVVGPRLIQHLRFTQHGQSNVREDTPEGHQKKKGTPTMGGTLILLCIAVGTLLFADLTSRYVWAAVVLTFGYGFIGFLDDWLKLSKRNSKGLAGKKKILLQTLFYAVAIFGLLCEWGGASGPGPHLLINTHLTLPFVPTRHFNPDLGWLYVALGWVVVVGTSNAVNITDGLDGLAIMPTIIAASTFAVLCYVAGTTLPIADYVDLPGGAQKLVAIPLPEYLRIPMVPSGAELSVFCASMVGAGFAFLWFNTYPASVFMGDIGSLALGGALGGMAMLSKNEVVSAIIHGVFLVEIVTVMIQVASFQLTGKRVFKMAPLHHHFELKGWPEPKIIVRFWIAALLCGGVALLSIKLR